MKPGSSLGEWMSTWTPSRQTQTTYLNTASIHHHPHHLRICFNQTLASASSTQSTYPRSSNTNHKETHPHQCLPTQSHPWPKSWPPEYKPQNLPRYDGSVDPYQFIMSYKAIVAATGGDEYTMAKSFIIIAQDMPKAGIVISNLDQ